MTPKFQKKVITVIFALIVTIFFSTGYAYASSNTLEQNLSGDGLSSISGYVIENVSYNLAHDSAQMDSVSFSLNAPATNVKVQLTTTQVDWYECVNTTDFKWTCSTNNVSLLEVNQLRVIASMN